MFQEKIALGLDVSDYKLRLVQLKKNRKKTKIISFSEIAVPVGLIVDGIIQDDLKVITLLKKLKKNIIGAHLQTDEVIAGFAEKQSFLKLISTQENNDPALIKEIKKHLPFELNEVYYNYNLIPSFSLNSNALHFAAAKKTLVENYLQTLQKADFEPEVFEIETEAITRCLLPAKNYDQQPTYVIVDIGRARTTVFITAKGLVIFSISFSSIIKKTEAYLSELITALRKVINFYNQQINSQQKISTIITCGSGAYIQYLNQETEKNFSLHSVPGNPWQNIVNYNSNLVKKIQYPLAYVTAIGLALRRALNKDYI